MCDDRDSSQLPWETNDDSIGQRNPAPKKEAGK